MANELPNLQIDPEGTPAQGAAKPANQPDERPQGISSQVTPLGPSPQQTTSPTKQLGIAEAGPGNINWLGSSYSGVDIKAVAHLYKSNLHDDQLNKLNKEKTELEQLQDVRLSLLNTIPTYGTRKSSAGLFSSNSPLTYDEVLVIWFNMAGWPKSRGAPPLSIQKKIRNYYQIYETSINGHLKVPVLIASELNASDAQITALNNKITFMQELNKESSSTVVLGTLQTISIQTHREKFGVRALGRSYVKGYTRGPRTIAGSMIFTVFNEHALSQLIKSIGNAAFIGESPLDTNTSTLIPDQLPPIDITMIYANEHGSISRQSIYGIEFVNDGQTMSIEDLMTEEVMNFVARDVDIMTSVGYRKLSQLEKGLWSSEEGKALEGTELLQKTLFGGNRDYSRYLTRLGVRSSVRSR